MEKSVPGACSPGLEACGSRGSTGSTVLMMKKIEEGVGNTLQSIPEKLNFPSKKDMDDLGKAIKTLNQRMNTLSKKRYFSI